jgi:hypothetical protein
VDIVRKMATAFTVVILVCYMAAYALGGMLANSKCPADTDINLFCSENPDVAKAHAFGLAALVCLAGIVAAVFWMTNKRHWYHALVLGVGVGACFVRPTGWAVLAGIATATAVAAPLFEGEPDEPDAHAAAVEPDGVTGLFEGIAGHIADIVTGIGGVSAVDAPTVSLRGVSAVDGPTVSLRGLPVLDVRAAASSVVAGALVIVGESGLVWSGLASIGVEQHRLLVGTLDVHIAIAAALLSVVALGAGLAVATVLSQHPAKVRATLLALLALTAGLYLAGRWSSAPLNYAGVGVAVAIAVRATRITTVARVIAVAIVTPLVSLHFGSQIAPAIMFVALAIPAADYAVAVSEYATETR